MFYFMHTWDSGRILFERDLYGVKPRRKLAFMSGGEWVLQPNDHEMLRLYEGKTMNVSRAEAAMILFECGERA